MKKTLLIVGTIGLAAISYAQPKNRTSAIMSLKNNYPVKAKGYIDKAIVHEKTKEDAKTWFYYAQIYSALMMSKDEKAKEFKEEAPEKAILGLKNAE